jgi:hypothetical protein
MLGEIAKLIPVSEWKYHRYQIKYSSSKEGKDQILEKILVSTETHMDGSVQRRWPSDYYDEYSWEILESNVPHPRPIGMMYGRPVYDDGWE